MKIDLTRLLSKKFVAFLTVTFILAFLVFIGKVSDGVLQSIISLVFPAYLASDASQNIMKSKYENDRKASMEEELIDSDEIPPEGSWDKHI